MSPQRSVIGIIRQKEHPRCYVFLSSREVAAPLLVRLLDSGHTVSFTDLRSLVIADVAKVFMSTCETDVFLDGRTDRDASFVLTSTMKDGAIPVELQGLAPWKDQE